MKRRFLLALLISLTIASCGDRQASSPPTIPSSTPMSTLSSLPSISPAASESGDKSQAIAAIKKLNASVEVGTNLVNYAPLVAEAKVAVDAVNDQSLKDAYQAHAIALDYWRCDIQDGVELDRFLAQDKCRDDVLKNQVFPAYPDIKAQVEEAYVAKKKPQYLSGALDNKAFLQALWQKGLLP